MSRLAVGRYVSTGHDDSECDEDANGNRCVTSSIRCTVWTIATLIIDPLQDDNEHQERQTPITCFRPIGNSANEDSVLSSCVANCATLRASGSDGRWFVSQPSLHSLLMPRHREVPVRSGFEREAQFNECTKQEGEGQINSSARKVGPLSFPIDPR